MALFVFLIIKITTKAHALSINVDLYGNASVYINRNQSGAGPITGLENEMYIGFKGKEKIKEELSAIYQFETSYMGDTGAVLGGRNTFVGLEGNKGQLRLGRLTTPLYEIIDWPFSHIIGQNFDWRQPVAAMAMADRSANTVRYDTPLWHNLNLGIAVAQQDSRSNNFFDIAVKYQLVNLSGYLGHQRRKGDELERNSTNLIGIQYEQDDFGIYTALKNVSLKHIATDVPDNDIGSTEGTSGMGAISAGDNVKQNNYVIAAYWGVEKWKSKIAFTTKNNIRKNGIKIQGTRATETALQLTYNFSNRTLAFIRLTIFDNSLHTRYAAVADNKDANRLYLGLSHDF